MSRPETEQTEGLRDIFGYRKEYDIVLACEFEESEKGAEKINLYEDIGRLVKRLGKRPFLPHKEIGKGWPPEKVVAITEGIVIPTADIVLAYIGLESLSTGIMIGSASWNSIPLIYLFEKEENFRGLKIGADIISKGMIDRGFVDTREYTRSIEYGAVSVANGNLNALEKCLRGFYS